MNIGLTASMRREIGVMTSRGSYLVMMVIVPLLLMFFFVGLLEPGLPNKVPTAIVDLDQSAMSRRLTRNLAATELISIDKACESYDKAFEAVRRGEIYGFFVIPADFQRDVVAGRKPTLEFFNNLTYFVPGTLAFKGFKTVAVTTTAGVVRTQLVSLGATDEFVMPMLQPVSIADNPIGNPWLNYSIYLSPSFIFGCLALLIMIMTAFGITMEIKHGTSVEWLSTAGGSMFVALAGKLIPQFVVWSVVGQFLLSLLFCYCGFPCGDLPALMVAMELFIIATQSVAVLFTCIVPNPRMALIMTCLTGILTFSFAGYSFPVQDMYGAIGIFSYLVPVRHLFQIYVFAGLDSFPIYYCRFYFAALILFPLVASTLVWRLRKACQNPVYVP